MKVALWVVLLGMCSAPPPPPPPLSPRVAKLLNDLGLNQYDTIFFNEEIDQAKPVRVALCVQNKVMLIIHPQFLFADEEQQLVGDLVDSCP